MKVSSNFVFIMLICLCSCELDKDNTIKSDDFPQKSKTDPIVDSNTPVIKSSPTKKTFFKDSFPTFEVDDYPITMDMLRKLDRTNGILKVTSGKTVTYDKVWFTDSHQTIVIELATDYHRFFTYHFLNEDVTDELMYDIEFHTVNGNLAADAQVKIDFSGFLDQSYKIDSKYFQSNKGIKLGINQQKAISTYGKPVSTSALKGIQKLEWSFYGDEEYLNESTEKPRAKDSFGHKIIMYFRKDKLIAQRIFNDIP